MERGRQIAALGILPPELAEADFRGRVHSGEPQSVLKLTILVIVDGFELLDGGAVRILLERIRLTLPGGWEEGALATSSGVGDGYARSLMRYTCHLAAGTQFSNEPILDKAK